MSRFAGMDHRNITIVSSPKSKTNLNRKLLRAHYPYSQLEGHLQNIFAIENCTRILSDPFMISSVAALRADASLITSGCVISSIVKKKKKKIDTALRDLTLKKIIRKKSASQSKSLIRR